MHRVKCALQLWRKLHNQSGQMLVLMAAGLAGFLGLVGLSIDVGQIVFTRTDLQKVADAAALAGSQDLPLASAAAANANAYVGMNAGNTSAVIKITSTYHANDTIEVTAKRHVNYTFLRAIGLSGSDVSAKAKVKVGTYSGGSRLAPWGLVASDVDDFLANACFDGFDPLTGMPTFKQNQLCYLKYGAGTSSGGDFGILALDGTGSEDYEEAIANGSYTSYETGELVEPQTGANVGKTWSGVNSLLSGTPPPDCNTQERDEILTTNGDGTTTITSGCEDHPRIIIIPVVDKIDDPNMSTILGFAFMFLHDVQGSGGFTKIVAEFVSFTSKVPGGVYNGDISGGGAIVSVLVE